jgi:hypothetical protein
VSQSKVQRGECAGEEWSPWTPVADLERAAPWFAHITDQSGEEVVAGLCHLRDMGLMEVRRGRRGRQEFRVRMDDAARATALLDDQAHASRN